MECKQGKTLGEAYCEHLSYPFDQVFHQQYFLRRSPHPCPEGFCQSVHHNWTLSRSPDLPVVEVTDKKGLPIGLILGWLVDKEGQLAKETIRIAANQSYGDFRNVFEEDLYEFSGRFVAILTAPGLEVAYTDPVSSFPLVYNSEAAALGSSLTLVLNRSIEPNPDFDTSLVSGLKGFDAIGSDAQRRKQQGGYSFGHTADKNTRLLRSNFRLSLKDFLETRFWPTPETDFSSLDSKQAAAKIKDRLRRNVLALARTGPGWLALSGGFDSRMVLAAVADVLPKDIRLFSHTFNWKSRIDELVAQAVARALERDFLSVRPTDGNVRASLRSEDHERRLAAFHDLACGFIGVMNSHVRRGCYGHVGRADWLIRGNMLEVVSGVWWPKPLIDSADIDANLRHAIRRTSVQVRNDSDFENRQTAMRDWFETIPASAQPCLHDLNYSENTLPHTQPQLLDLCRGVYFAPSADRQIFHLSMRVPIKRRISRKFHAEIVDAGDPRMSDIPFVFEIVRNPKSRRHRIFWPERDQMA